MSVAHPMMKCGHAANAQRILEDGSRVPSCVICAGIVLGADEIDESPPSLKGRYAGCSCGAKALSDADERSDVAKANGRIANRTLPFFRHYPDRAEDTYYCGHAGWD